MTRREGEDGIGVRWSIHLYRALLWTYPRAFREQYGDKMVQAFRDLCRDAAREDEAAFPSLWVQAVLDLLCSAFELRAAEWRRVVMAHRALTSGLCLSAIAVGAVALHTHNELAQVSDRPMFPSPEVGMVEMYGGPGRVEITGVGREFQTLHYVVATVESIHCGGDRVRCSVGGYFLKVEGGWVFLPEGWFTALIPAGTRMLGLFNIA